MSSPRPGLARASLLLAMLIEGRAEEADLFDQLLDDSDSRDLAHSALSLAAAVIQSAWGDRAIDRLKELRSQIEGDADD